MPTMPSGWPSMRTRVTVSPDDTATPGVAATRSATSAVTTPRKPVPLTAKSAVSWVSTRRRDGLAHRRREHGHERHQADADHQRRRRGRRAPRVAHRVLAGERAGDAAQAGQRTAERLADRSGDGRAEDGEGEEPHERAEAEDAQPVAALQGAERRRARRPPRRPTAPAIARPTVLVVRSTSRSRSAASGEMVAARRPGIAADTVVTTTPDEDGDDEGAGGDDVADGRQPEAEPGEQRLQRLGHAEAGEHARPPTPARR